MVSREYWICQTRKCSCVPVLGSRKCDRVPGSSQIHVLLEVLAPALLRSPSTHCRLKIAITNFTSLRLTKIITIQFSLNKNPALASLQNNRLTTIYKIQRSIKLSTLNAMTQQQHVYTTQDKVMNKRLPINV